MYSICLLFLEPETFEFFSEIEQQTELKVGMRLNVTLVAVYPNGLYSLTGISLYDDTSDKNFDVVDVTCILGRGVQYSIYYHQSNYVDKEVSFHSKKLFFVLFGILGFIFFVGMRV